MQENIRNLIYDSILKSYRKSPQFVCIDEKRYLKEEQDFLDRIFDNPDTSIDYIKSSDGEIMSYVVFNKKENLLHYVYTLLKYRHQGTAQSLINKNFPLLEKEIITSHYTKTLKYFFEKINRTFKYKAALRYE